MKSDKHILLLTPGFATDEMDDSCIPALQVYVKTFHELYPDYKISIVAFHYPYKTTPYKWNGISIYPCNGRNIKWLKAIRTFPFAKKYFNTIHAEQRVDLIHSFWLGECTAIGEELAQKHNIPHLNTLMGQDVCASNRYLKKSNLLNIPNVALSDRHALEFEENARRKPDSIIPWGIEDGKVETSNERSIDIFAAGSLIELKRYDWLVKAVAQIKNDFPQVSVVLAGDGPCMDELKKLANDLGVNKNIHFTGQISRNEVLEYMGKSKIFCHPSEFESYGFVFAEARKYGMAIVSSLVGIAKESENWKLADNLDGMVNAINYFLKNKTDCSSEIIYSSRATADAYAKLYEKMISAIRSIHP